MEKQHLKNIFKIRELEKDRLFDLLFEAKSKRKIQKQFLKYEKAHKEAFKACKGVDKKLVEKIINNVKKEAK